MRDIDRVAKTIVDVHFSVLAICVLHDVHGILTTTVDCRVCTTERSLLCDINYVVITFYELDTVGPISTTQTVYFITSVFLKYIDIVSDTASNLDSCGLGSPKLANIHIIILGLRATWTLENYSCERLKTF